MYILYLGNYSDFIFHQLLLLIKIENQITNFQHYTLISTVFINFNYCKRVKKYIQISTYLVYK